MNDKLAMITNLFEGKEIRSIWNMEEEKYYFSVVDAISILTDNSYEKSRNYWKWLKNQLNKEGSQLVSNTNQLKMKAKDGKYYKTDTLDMEGILRLIESVPSKKAEPFKLWLAHLGKVEIDSVFDPSIGMDRMIDYYLRKGYSLSWVRDRIDAILDRRKLTETWKNHGVEEQSEYAILTNQIYQTWSGMTAKEYKKMKNIQKESLRDHMSDLEILLTNIGEVATRELTEVHHPIGLEQNKLISEVGGGVAFNTKKDLEEKLGRKIVSSDNNRKITDRK